MTRTDLAALPRQHDAAAGPAPADRDVDELRAEIDHLDGTLVELLARRREVSRAIQQRRVATGGPRIQHARERAVLARYRDALGAGGSRLGMAVLELCRGRALD